MSLRDWRVIRASSAQSRLDGEAAEALPETDGRSRPILSPQGRVTAQ